MKPKHQRLIFILFSVVFLTLAVIFTLRAFDENLVYFYSPTDIAEKPPASAQKIRVGGLVTEGSIKKDSSDIVHFIISDGKHDVRVEYRGALPNLFREKQGVIAEGTFNSEKLFVAKTILAKHDEKYMPKEVVDALKKSGQWREGGSEDAR